jgi:acetyl esterase/lipase
MIWDSLKPGGTVAFWAAAVEPGFERKLRRDGFVSGNYSIKAHERAKKPIHWIYVGTRPVHTGEGKGDENVPAKPVTPTPAVVKAAVGLSGPYDFHPFDSPRSIAAFSEWSRPEETQPITYASANAPPLLLVTSDGDTTVRPRNANNLAARLRELGAPVEVTNYGPLDHEEVVMALSKPFRSKGPVLADSVAFLRAQLGE